MRTILILSLLATRALAQETPDGGAATPTPPPPTEQEIQNAIQADQEAKAKAAPNNPSISTPGTNAPPGSISPPGTVPVSSVQGGSALGRFVQSLNPDISAIVDFAGGWYSNDSETVKSGDDPAKTGINLQELEIALNAVVDPYFRADIYLTIPNAQALEIEEAYLTTTRLPWNFQLKAGIFRADVGRQNTLHLHQMDFTRRPAINPQFLGIDGLRAPGIELNWLVPRLPFYLVLAFSMFSVPAAEPDQVLQTFGGGKPWDFAYVATARAFFDIKETTSLYVGLNYAHGKTSQFTTTGNTSIPMVAPGAPTPTTFDNYYDNLYGADLYLKWKPANQAKTYTSLAWTTEYFVRQIPGVKDFATGMKIQQVEGGMYTQLVLQAHRRWYLGLRGELMGIPSGVNVQREYAAAGSVTWALSEFSRIRLYGDVRIPHKGASMPNPVQPTSTYGSVFLQIEAAIGAHGAHPY